MYQAPLATQILVHSSPPFLSVADLAIFVVHLAQQALVIFRPLGENILRIFCSALTYPLPGAQVLSSLACSQEQQAEDYSSPKLSERPTEEEQVKKEATQE